MDERDHGHDEGVRGDAHLGEARRRLVPERLGHHVEDAYDEDDEEETSRTYKLDLDSGRIIGFVDDLDAVEQAIRKAVATPRFDCLIYDDQYGSETGCADMALGATEEYRRSAIEGFIRDALSQDTRILEVGEFEIEFVDDEAYVSFSVSTIFGEIKLDTRR